MTSPMIRVLTSQNGVTVDAPTPLSSLDFSTAMVTPTNGSQTTLGAVAAAAQSTGTALTTPVNSGLAIVNGAISAVFGTGAGQIAQGNDSRITGALQSTALSSAGGNIPLLSTAGFLPASAIPVDGTSLTVSNGKISAPGGGSGSATGTSTAVTTTNLMATYARPLNDFIGETIHVVSFVPSGTAISAVTDWGPIWNAALQECRAQINAGNTFHLVGPTVPQNIATTVNGTMVAGTQANGNAFPATKLASFGSIIDFQGASITCSTTGKATFDFIGSWWIRFRGLNLTGNLNALPTIGIQIGRSGNTSGPAYAAGSTAYGQNADTLFFTDCFIGGCFSFAAYYNNNSESFTGISCWISNNCPLSQATGVQSVNGTPTPNAPKVCFSIVLDVANHWQVPTLFPGGIIQTGGQSFEQFLMVGCTITADYGSAMWMSSGTNHSFLNCYFNSGSTVSLIDWYRTDNDGPHNFNFEIHCENAGPNYATLFRIIGDLDPFATVCDGFRFRDGGDIIGNYFMSQATITPNTIVWFNNLDILISQGFGIGSTPPLMFNNPALFRTTGVIRAQAAIYNGAFDQGQGYGHSGQLSLADATGFARPMFGGQALWSGSVTPAAITSALAELGMVVTSDSIGSVTITSGGNYYTQSAAFTPTVTFSAPGVGGTQATASGVQLGLAGPGGLTATGSGYTTANGLAVQDASGNTLPYTVNITASGGAITAITGVNTVGSGLVTAVPAAPFKIVQSGASGGTITGSNFSIVAVTGLNGGSGYQSASSPPTVTFSTINAAPSASGTIVMTSALTVSSVTTSKGSY